MARPKLTRITHFSCQIWRHKQSDAMQGRTQAGFRRLFHQAQQHLHIALLVARLFDWGFGDEGGVGEAFVVEQAAEGLKAHLALAELADDAIALVNDHARLEVADFVEQHTMGGTGGVAVGIARVALRAGFHAFTLLIWRIPGRNHCSTWRRGAQWGIDWEAPYVCRWWKRGACGSSINTCFWKGKTGRFLRRGIRHLGGQFAQGFWNRAGG